jgi:wyosine [tRNA(Phe)-imidazoG37] synthetase (radical SAM superfamily)
MNYKYLFGPVPSRRLGISLGVDLIPYKTCNFNCIYCESGKTTNLTNERKEYISSDFIINELNYYLSTLPELDFITFSGAGEPTLNSGIGKILHFIHTNFPQFKTALITNSALFADEILRKEIANIDLILPSLDAVSQSVFSKINRSASNLKSDEIVAGLIEFAKEFRGRIWLEIFIVPGVNDTPEELKLLKEVLQKIQPERVQLNTLDRPGTESEIIAASKVRLEDIAEFFKPLPAEIIAKFKTEKISDEVPKEAIKTILDTIQRRPCTKIDLMQMLNIKEIELDSILRKLLYTGTIKTESLKRGTFYKISN